MMMNLPPQFEQYDPLRVAQQQNVVQGGRLSNQTALLTLEDMRRAQEEATLARQFMAANAGQMVPGGGGGPLLASPALTAGGGGPMTQQTVVPGQPPGAPQPVPGGQDLSRFATGGGMPGGAPASTLGGLQPQQDPFEARMQALMAQSPGAALQVMQTRMKLQEQQLTWGLKSIEAVAQMTHGVKNQEDLDRVRAQMQQIAPQAAAQLPQFYSAEALDAFQEKALSVKERQTLKIQDVQAQANALQAQAEAMKVRLSAQQQAGAVPKYTEDSTLNVAIDTLMQQAGLPRGTPPPPHILAQAQNNVQQGKVDVSAAQGAQGARERALGETGQQRLAAYDKAGLTAQTTHGTLDQIEALITSPEGVYGNSPDGRLAMARYNAGLAPNDQKARNTAQLRNLASQLQLAHGSLGTGVSVYDAQVYAKASGDLQNAQNVDQMKQYIGQMRPILDTAMTRANEARTSWEKTGTLPEFGRERKPQGGQGGASGGGPPAGKGGTVKLETLADYAAKHNLPIGQVIKQAYEKGVEIE